MNFTKISLRKVKQIRFSCSTKHIRKLKQTFCIKLQPQKTLFKKNI